MTVAAFNAAFNLWQSNCNFEILVSALSTLAMHGFGAVTVFRNAPTIMNMINDAHRAMDRAHINLPNWLARATHVPIGFNPFQGPARSLADAHSTSSSSSSSGPIVLTHPPHGLNYVPPVLNYAPIRPARPGRPLAIDNWLPKAPAPAQGPPKPKLLVPKHTTSKQTMLHGVPPPPRVVPPRPNASGSGRKKKKVETIETKKALMPYFDIMDDPYFIKV